MPALRLVKQILRFQNTLRRGDEAVTSRLCRTFLQRGTSLVLVLVVLLMLVRIWAFDYPSIVFVFVRRLLVTDSCLGRFLF